MTFLQKIKNKKKLIFINLILLICFSLPILSLTANNGYQLLEPSIIINNNNQQPENYGLKEYLQTAYVLLLVLVISAVVFWFIVGGLEYILSDTLNSKIGGKNKLMKALLGLAIALSSFLLLNLINPDLLNFDLVLP